MVHLDNFLKWLNDNQWLNLIFLLLAILSIIVSIYLFSKSKRKKKPQYSKRSINVISDSLHNVPNVEVLYLGNKINNLTVTKVAIWNDGNETINFSDLAATDKLRIEALENITIFNSEIIHQTSPTNNIKTRVSNNVINIEFDYLDQNQGGIIKVIHSGEKSSDLDIKGTFKSAGQIRELNTSVFGIALNIVATSFFSGKKRNPQFSLKAFPWISLITGLIMVGASLYIQAETGEKIFLRILGGIYFVMGVGMFFSKNTLPKNFKAFYDDE